MPPLLCGPQVGSSACNLISFTGVLYSISPPLLVFLASYAAAGTFVMTRVFGRRLTVRCVTSRDTAPLHVPPPLAPALTIPPHHPQVLNTTCLKTEGDFRFALARMREHAESVAFYGGARAEAGLAVGLLYRLAAALFERIACERKLTMFGAVMGHLKSQDLRTHSSRMILMSVLNMFVSIPPVEAYHHMTSFLPMMVLSKPCAPEPVNPSQHTALLEAPRKPILLRASASSSRQQYAGGVLH